MIYIETKNDSFEFDNRFAVDFPDSYWVRVYMKGKAEKEDSNETYYTMIPKHLIESLSFD